MVKRRKKPRPIGKGSPSLKQLNKLRPILTFLLEKYKPKCFFCGEILTDIFKFTEHHVDQDRSNNKIENREPSHRRCHKSFHVRYTKEVTELIKED